MVGYQKTGPKASGSDGGSALSPCPLCPRKTDRFGWCRSGHPAVQARGITYIHEDFRHNLCVDPDAPVLTWRQEKGHRLGFENSREAVVWSVFRSLEVLGVAGEALGPLLGLKATPRMYFWARDMAGAPWPPFAGARAELERYVKGPDVNSAEPDVVLVDEAGKQVVFVDADVAAPVGAAGPRWFTAAGTPSERRVKRAILDAMTAEADPLPFRRGLDDAIRRGFYGLARRLLLAGASARRIRDAEPEPESGSGSGVGGEWTGRLVSVINPTTMRRCVDDVARFADLLTPGAKGSYAAVTWADVWARVPPDARAARKTPLRLSLEDYLKARTINRAPAGLIP